MTSNITVSLEPSPEFIEALRVVIREEIQSEKRNDALEKLLSPSEAVKIFVPHISKVTLSSWTNQGLLKKYTISGKTFYKYTELIDSAKHLKKYKNKAL